MGAPQASRVRSSLRFLVRSIAAGLVAGLAMFGTNALASHQFPDVSDTSPFHDQVAWLADQSIASGFPDGTFRPKDPVNRQQVASWLSNYNSSIYLTNQNTDLDPGTSFAAEAQCGTAQRPLAGGALTFDTNLRMRSSFPLANGWAVAWDSTTNYDPGEVSVWVLCAPDIAS